MSCCIAKSIRWFGLLGLIWLGLGMTQAHARTPLGTITQAHDFEKPTEDLDSADVVLLFGVFPAVGVANAVAITGSIVALARKRGRRAWGGAALVVGILTILGSPLIADQGPAWMALPLSVGATSIALGITGLVLGGRSAPQKAKPMEMRPSGKTGGSLVPLLAATQ